MSSAQTAPSLRSRLDRAAGGLLIFVALAGTVSADIASPPKYTIGPHDWQQTAMAIVWASVLFGLVVLMIVREWRRARKRNAPPADAESAPVKMPRARFLGLISGAIALAGLCWVLRPIAIVTVRPPRHRPERYPQREPLLVYCAASNRAVVEAIRRDYEAETGRTVAVHYGASQTLLSALQVSETGDLYLPADESYLDLAQQKGLVEERFSLASMRAVLVVRRDHPSPPESWEALLNGSFRLVQADPEAAAIGKLTRATLEPAGHWEALAKRTEAFKSNVNEVANDVQLGAADVGIVYDAVLFSYPELRAIQLPELNGIVAHVGVGVLRSSRQPREALHFARYLAASDRGANRYRVQGFQPVAGDVWFDWPTLRLVRTDDLPPEFIKFVQQFTTREGIVVTYADADAGTDLVVIDGALQLAPQGGPRSQLAARFLTRLRALTPAPILYERAGPSSTPDRP